jgi:imidazolonepropionase-like amidohydrolase
MLVLCMVVPTVSLSQVAVVGETIYTMNGDPIMNGVVLIEGGKIEAVGPAADITIPPAYTVITGKVVTPGIIDAHTVVGLAGILNVPHDQMQLEKSSAMQPELRAIDAYNPRVDLVEFVRSLGVTTIHTGHAPGALASGTSVVVKTTGGTVADAMMHPGMVTFAFGRSARSNYKNPGTSAKAVAVLRAELIKAHAYAKKRQNDDASKRPARDLKLEQLADVLTRKIKVLFTAHTATDIQAALRVQKEFGFDMVIDGAAEADLVLDELKASGVPVIIHPTMARPRGDTKNISFETAKKLHEAGILFAFQSGYESYVPKTRVVHYEAAVAAGFGLPFDAALAAITTNPAKILGIEGRVGSLEEGKDADVVIFDGDPFEYTTHVCGVVIDGQIVSETCK